MFVCGRYFVLHFIFRFDIMCLRDYIIYWDWYLPVYFPLPIVIWLLSNKRNLIKIRCLLYFFIYWQYTTTFCLRSCQSSPTNRRLAFILKPITHKILLSDWLIYQTDFHMIWRSKVNEVLPSMLLDNCVSRKKNI